MRTTINFHGANIVLTCAHYIQKEIEESEAIDVYVFYKGRRSYMNIECAPNGVLEVNGVKYIASSDGHLLVDLTDIIMEGGTETQRLAIGYNGYTMMLDYWCEEGIHPEEANMLAPHNSDKCLHAGSYVYSLAGKVYFCLPNVILRSELMSLYANVPMLNFPIWRDVMAGEGTIIIDTEETSVSEYDIDIEIQPYARNIQFEDIAKTMSIQMQDASDECVMVEWTSSVGVWTDKSGRNDKVKKRAFWNLLSNKTSTSVRALQTISAGYDFQKGASNEITIQLKGLDAYSLWYYSDIVYSNEVRVMFKNGNELLFNDSKAMPINKDVTMRYGNDGTYYDLSVTLKVLDYDTI